MLSLDGIKPTRKNIASGAYPLFRPLYLVTQGNPSLEVKGFLEWLLGDEGQQAVADQGTVNLREGFRLLDLYRAGNQRANPK